MSKYKQYFNNMLSAHQALFEKFMVIHSKYVNDPKTYQKDFNEIGKDVVDIVRKYENMLCSQSEGTGYGKFSTTLSDKFQKEVKTLFPKIDSVGLED